MVPRKSESRWADVEDSPQETVVRKTSVCTFWKKGKCQRGRFCTFAHGHAELHEQVSLPITACQFYRAGFCRLGSSCRNLHEAASDEAADCLALIQDLSGDGQRSPMLSPVLSAASAPGDSVLGGRRVCVFWKQSRCKRGASCDFSHSFDVDESAAGLSRRVTLCPFNAAGSCKFGDRCRHAHRAEELLRPRTCSDLGMLCAQSAPASLRCSPHLRPRGASEPRLADDGHAFQLSRSALSDIIAEEGDSSKAPQPDTESSCTSTAVQDAISESHFASDSSGQVESSKTVVKRHICKYWTKGRCQRGVACTFAHGSQEIHEAVADPVYKASLCKFFERGCCRMGGRCRQAHGDDELRLASAKSRA